MLPFNADNDRRHSIRELEKAIESLTIMQDVVSRYYAKPSSDSGGRAKSNFVLVRIEEEIARKKEELERLKGMV